MDKIYEPYFTTKAPGKGTGLGLAVVFGIVKDLDGEITIHSEVNQGTRVEIRLPRMASEASREDPVPVPEDIAGGHECILLVEDEPPIAKMASRMLERMGYRVESHLNSREALQCFKRNPDGYDLVITDATMPQITGDRLAAEIRALRPGLPIVICSGFSERLNPAKLHALGINRVLMKPITKSELARTVRKVLDQTIGTDSRSEG